MAKKAKEADPIYTQLTNGWLGEINDPARAAELADPELKPERRQHLEDMRRSLARRFVEYGGDWTQLPEDLQPKAHQPNDPDAPMYLLEEEVEDEV